MREINPKATTRAQQFEIWKNAPNPMLVFVKKLDVTKLLKISKKKHLKFNMLMDYCIGKAAINQKEFYLLPVGDKLMQFDKIAVNTMVKNHTGEVSSCDIEFSVDFNNYCKDYLKYTYQVANSCMDRDISEECRVIGTSAIVDTPISEPRASILERSSSIEILDSSKSTIIIITKLPDKIVWLISAILILFSARIALTLAIIPFWSEPTTVIIAFIRLYYTNLASKSTR